MGNLLQGLVSGVQGVRNDMAGAMGIPPNSPSRMPQSSTPEIPGFSGQGTGQAQGATLPTPTVDAPNQGEAAPPSAANPMDFMSEEDPVSAVYDNPGQGPEEVAQPNNPYTNMDDPNSMLPTPEEEITVQGDGWKKKSAGLIGGLLDNILLMKGKAPVFSLKANLPEIMKGFQRDPEQALRRMEKVHAPTAWQMRQEHTQMEANDALADGRRQDQKIKGYRALGGMIDALPKDPELAAQVYPKLVGAFRRRAEAFGIDPSEFGDTYDADQLQMIKAGGTSAYEDVRAEDFDLAREGTENHRREQRISLDNYREARIEQGNRRLDMQEDNINTDNARADAVAARGPKESQLTAGQLASVKALALKKGFVLDPMFAPYTHLPLGQYQRSPDGKKIVLRDPTDRLLKVYPITRSENGKHYFDKGKAIFTGTTVDDYLSR